MKNTSLILSVISLIAVVVFGVLTLTKGNSKTEVATEDAATETAACKGSIVYVDLDRILTEYDMANDLGSVVETKVKNIQVHNKQSLVHLENTVSKEEMTNAENRCFCMLVR